MNGKTYHKNGLLNNMSGTLYVWLIGNKDVRMSKEGITNVYLFVDNTKCTKPITVPNSVEKVYCEQNSHVNMVKENRQELEINEIK